MKRIISTLLILATLLPNLAFAQSRVFLPVQGGTGTSTKPTFGQLLMGNANGLYDLVSTSSLGITGGSGSGTVNSGLIGQAAFYAGTGTAVSGTSTLFFLNEKVGIGTTTPDSELTVDGSLSIIPGTLGSLPFRFVGAPTTGIYYGTDPGNSIRFVADGVDALFVDQFGLTTANGTQGAPAFSFIDSGTTGLFSPSTGALALSASANEVLRITPGGDVGIGTTSPSAKLAIRGEVGKDYFTIASSSSFSTVILTVKSTGNVGIATTTPNYPLTVAGDTNLTGALRSNGDAGTNGYILQTTGTGVQWVATSSLGISGGSGSGTVNSGTQGQVAYYAGAGTAVSGTSTVFIATSTNVGIGTTTPVSKLHVTGAGIFQPQAFTLGEAVTDALMIWDFQPGANTAGSIYVRSSNGQVRSLFGFNSTTGTFTLGDTSNNVDTLALKAGGSVGTGKITFTTFGAGEAMRITNAGNVGIGTNAPLAGTSVTGTSGGVDIQRVNDSGTILRLGNLGTVYYDFARSATTGALHIQGNQTSFNNIALVPTSGRVGINDATPLTQLSVGNVSTALGTTAMSGAGVSISSASAVTIGAENTAASSAASGGAFGLFYSNDGAAMASGDRLGGLLFGGSSSASALRNTTGIVAYSSQNWSDGSAYGSRLAFETTANSGTTRSEKMTVTGDGLVGIGTTAPLANLSIGNITSVATDTPVDLSLGGTFGNSTLGSYTNSKLRVWDNGSSYYGLGLSAGTLEYVTDSLGNSHVFLNGTTETMRIVNGNVGINKTVPAQKLDVDGNIQIPTTSSTAGAIFQNSSRLLHTYGSTNTFIGQGAGNFTFNVASNGANVGIGNGALSGLAGTTGNEGSFNMGIGRNAGSGITTGQSNILIGNSVGTGITTNSHNTIIGDAAGFSSTGLSGVVYLGRGAGRGINTFTDTIFIGQSAGGTTDGGIQTATGLTNAIAIGARSSVDASHTMSLGGTGSYAVNVGIGSTSPSARLSIHTKAGTAGTLPVFNIASSTTANTATSTLFTVLGSGNVGIGTTTPLNPLHVVSTNTQLRLGYDNTSADYMSIGVDSTGLATFESVSSSSRQGFKFNDSVRKPIKTVSTTSYTATLSDYRIYADDDGAGGAVTITLPSAIYSGLEYTFKKLGSTGSITIQVQTGDFLEGVEDGSYQLTVQGDWVTIVCDGGQWWVEEN